MRVANAGRKGPYYVTLSKCIEECMEIIRKEVSHIIFFSNIKTDCGGFRRSFLELVSVVIDCSIDRLIDRLLIGNIID